MGKVLKCLGERRLGSAEASKSPDASWGEELGGRAVTECSGFISEEKGEVLGEQRWWWSLRNKAIATTRPPLGRGHRRVSNTASRLKDHVIDLLQRSAKAPHYQVLQYLIASSPPSSPLKLEVRVTTCLAT